MRRLARLLAVTVLGLMSAAAVRAAPEAPICAPGEGRRACLAAAMDETAKALIAAREQALKAIRAWDGNLDEADRAEWARRFGDVFYLWLAQRDIQCAPELIGHERRVAAAEADLEAMACRVRLGRVIVADLNARFEGEGGQARFSFTEAARGRPIRRNLIGAEGERPLCRHPGTGGDYEPLTRCFDRHGARLDRQLAALESRTLAKIRNAANLTAAERRDWAERAAASQRNWRELRDKACALEAFETPNRFAHSIASQVTGPCLVAETEARIGFLRSTYALR